MFMLIYSWKPEGVGWREVWVPNQDCVCSEHAAAFFKVPSTPYCSPVPRALAPLDRLGCPVFFLFFFLIYYSPPLRRRGRKLRWRKPRHGCRQRPVPRSKPRRRHTRERRSRRSRRSRRRQSSRRPATGHGRRQHGSWQLWGGGRPWPRPALPALHVPHPCRRPHRRHSVPTAPRRMRYRPGSRRHSSSKRRRASSQAS